MMENRKLTPKKLTIVDAELMYFATVNILSKNNMNINYDETTNFNFRSNYFC